MRISRLVKSMLYLSVFALFVGLCAAAHMAMRSPMSLNGAFFRTIFTMFFAGIILISAAVYMRRAPKEHKSDLRFLLIYGISLTLTAIILFMAYGDLNAADAEKWYTSANILIAASGIAPVPLLFAAFIPAVRNREMDGRRAVTIAAAICTAVYIALLAFGMTWRFIYPEYDEDGYLITYDENVNEE